MCRLYIPTLVRFRQKKIGSCDWAKVSTTLNKGTAIYVYAMISYMFVLQLRFYACYCIRVARIKILLIDEIFISLCNLSLVVTMFGLQCRGFFGILSIPYC